MKKLAILGASYLQLPLVLKAKENNIEVHCFAWDDGKAICKDFSDFYYDISVLNQNAILEKCKEIGIDGITTIATDICIPTIAHIVNEMNLNGNSIECSKLTTNKGLMRDCFYKNHISSPKHLLVKCYSQSQFSDISFPLIVKPTDRSGSLGVIKVYNQNELKNAIESCIGLSLEKSCVVEEFINGNEVSVETISCNGNHTIITVTDKILTQEPFFVELAHHQPSQHCEKIINKIKAISLKILDATKVSNGASHIELKITPQEEIFAIEIGSRMGGDFIGSHLVELSTGFDYLQAVIEIALGSFKENIIQSVNKYSGVYFLSSNTKQLMNFFNDENLQDFQIIEKKILNNNLKMVESSNDRSGYLIYQSDKKINLL